MADERLSKRETELVKQYGDFYRSLIGGKRMPETPLQIRFIAAFHNRVPPETEHEIAFAKHARLEKVRRTVEAT